MIMVFILEIKKDGLHHKCIDLMLTYSNWSRHTSSNIVGEKPAVLFWAIAEI